MGAHERGIDGGALAAEALARHQVPFLFTLCGGHISPLLVAAKRRGIRVVDTRHEATAVFAADAVARLSGRPGVAAVTAGPGLTNTLTAIKNAQLAQSPLILIGGATATMLRGRGALQDIDQAALMAPHVKAVLQAEKLRQVQPLLEDAFSIALHRVPGPVFVELPVDILYPEETVRRWYLGASGDGKGIRSTLFRAYLERHLRRIFAPGRGAGEGRGATSSTTMPTPSAHQIKKAARMVRCAERPVLVLGSQGALDAEGIESVAACVLELGVPTYLSGMARGLLGRSDRLLLRHRRRQALKEADLVVLA
ncbi:MAG TPA: thiamine pyrophosphate-binding protein, partial [Thermoanaerobaculia bacterium]|nr:thiamine pyrophosphate-binding protein [Thermoanaerobaculia bacterium]